jgi:hypothetical protein
VTPSSRRTSAGTQPVWAARRQRRPASRLASPDPGVDFRRIVQGAGVQIVLAAGLIPQRVGVGSPAAPLVARSLDPWHWWHSRWHSWPIGPGAACQQEMMRSGNDLRSIAITRCSQVIPDFRRAHRRPITACVGGSVLIALRGGHLRRRPRRLGWPRTPDFQTGPASSHPSQAESSGSYQSYKPSVLERRFFALASVMDADGL